MSRATTITSLESARDDIASLIETQTAAWVAAGMPVNFSVDGESYQWESWLKSQCEAIDALTETIQKLSSPYIIRSRGRA